MSPSATPATQSGAVPRATERAQARSPVPQVQRLPRKQRCMSPSILPATQNEGGCHQVPCLPRKVARCPGRPSAPKRATRASPVLQVPRLPRETKVDVTQCHTCHAKEGGCHQVLCLSRKVAWRLGRPSALKRATRASPVLQMPHLLREAKVDVAKCHAAMQNEGGGHHAKWHGVNAQLNVCER